jgi:hypothetical protein
MVNANGDSGAEAPAGASFARRPVTPWMRSRAEARLQAESQTPPERAILFSEFATQDSKFRGSGLRPLEGLRP